MHWCGSCKEICAHPAVAKDHWGYFSLSLPPVKHSCHFQPYCFILHFIGLEQEKKTNTLTHVVQKTAWKTHPLFFPSAHTRRLPDSVTAGTIFSRMNKTCVPGWGVNKGEDKGNSSSPLLEHPFCQISIIYWGALTRFWLNRPGLIAAYPHALSLFSHDCYVPAGMLTPSHFWGITYKLSWGTDPCPSDWKSRLSPDSAWDKAGHTRILCLTHARSCHFPNASAPQKGVTGDYSKPQED